MNTAKSTKRLGLLVAIAAALLSLQLLAVSAASAATQGWQIVSISNSTVSAGEELTYSINVFNRSEDTSSEGPAVTLTLPAGLSGASFEDVFSSGFDCGSVAGLSVITCTTAQALESDAPPLRLRITVAVDPGASGIKTAHFEASGASLDPGTTVAPVRISPTPPPFGIDAFDMQIGDPDAPYTRAAGHPVVQTTALAFNTATDPSPTANPLDSGPIVSVIGPNQPIEPVKDIVVDLPAGLVGSPAAVAQCNAGQLANTIGILSAPECDPSSQVGTAEVIQNGGDLSNLLGPFPVFNMVPPPGVPARFGISILSTLISLDASVRSGSDYGLRITSRNTSGGISVVGTKVDFWGVPADPAHEFERSCPGERAAGDLGPSCASSAEPAAFLRTPTSCSDAGLETTMRANSWFDTADFASRTVRTHEGPGYPYPEEEGPEGAMTRVWGDEVGIEDCDQVPFEPTMQAQLTTNSADAPTGLSVDLGLPDDCWDAKATAQEAEEAICQSDMKETRVTLPQGLSLNPSAAGGLGSCSPQQVGLSTPVGSSPVRFDEAPVSCPDSAKIGKVEISTPQLALHGKDGSPVLDGEGNPILDPLKGSIYLAQQSQNPFGSLVALYLVAEGSGVRVKQAGRIELSNSGQLTTTFDSIPQSPVSNIHFELFGGPRAALRTPPTCGTYTTTATLTPWSGNAAVNASSSFGVSQGCGGGFDPKLYAGTQNPLAGAFSPFSLRLSRDDGSAEIAGLRLAIPKGLVASLKDIPYCPDATLNAISDQIGAGTPQINSPSCPAASQVGTVTAGAGAGPTPFYSTTGKAYWAGPYKGAPVSLAAVVPAVAGPFDLGNVVVRNGFEVDPESAQITAVSDPFPTILHGIPLDLRDIRLNLNRPNYTLNPTSCDPLSFEADISSVGGAHAKRSQHFQAAACDRLAFKPKLSFRLKGKTNRGAHPALTAIVTMPAGGANLAKAAAALPHSEFLDQSHIGTVCTRVQYAAGGGGGEQCPAKSIYGHARAYSPILGYYLQGPVFLRSSAHKLPDLVLGLHGPPAQPIQVDAVGRIDSTKGGGIRTSFESVPDVPVSKVVLSMRGGKKGLLQNSANICKGTHKAAVTLTAHNADVRELAPEMKADCGPKARKAKGKGKGKAGNYRP